MALSKAERKRRDTVQAYLDIFESERGAIVLQDLREQFQNRSSFDENPYVTSFHEGARKVYLRIMEIMDDARRQRSSDPDIRNLNSTLDDPDPESGDDGAE